MMNKTFRASQDIILYSLITFLFFIGIVPLVATIALVAAILIWAINKGWKESFDAIRENKTWWIFIAFYAFHVLSLFWSENIKYAFFDLQIKLSYLLCPVVFAGFTLSETDWKKLRAAFIAGTLLASLICMGNAMFQFLSNGTTEYFFYNKFSVLMHPTYFMVYLNLSVLFIFYDLFWHRDGGKRRRYIYMIALFLQLLTLFLLSARTALATCLITFIIYAIVMFRQKKFVKMDAIPVTLFFICAVVFQLGILSFFNRYDQVTEVIKHPDTKEENSTSIRYNLWKIAGDLILEHPVAGVGIGDIKEELLKKYEEYHYEYGIVNKISPHNQYLHTAVILGLTGVFLLLAMLASAFLLAWRNGDWIYMLFVVIIAMNCITESILERQAGILFFAFFNSMFATRLIGTGKEKR